MYNPDNKCFVKVSLELIPEHLLCKYNEHKKRLFDHVTDFWSHDHSFSVHSRGYLSCIFNLWRLIILKGSKLCIQLKSVSSCVTNPWNLCQWVSHCDLLTHLDISDTVTKFIFFIRSYARKIFVESKNGPSLFCLIKWAIIISWRVI